MIEAYKIGVSLVMETNVPGAIGGLISEFEKLNTIIKEANASVTSLGARLRGLAGSVPGLNKVAEAINKVNEAAARGGGSSGGGGRSSGSGGGMVSAPLMLGYSGGGGAMVGGGGGPALTNARGQLLLAGPRAGGMPPLNVGGGGGMGGGGGRGLGFNPLGGNAMVVEFGVYELLKKTVEEAEKLNHEMIKLQTGMRLSDEETSAEAAKAFVLSRLIPGSHAADLLKQKRELAGTMGTMEHAAAVAELVARGSLVTSNYVDKDTDLAKIAVRALEIRGQLSPDHKTVDPAMFEKEFSSLVRSIIASEGLLDPAKFLAFIQQAGPAARMMGNEEFWGRGPAIMNALGSSKAGTALNSLFAQMIGHVVAGSRVAEAMQEAGMLKPGSWKVGRGGKVTMDRDAVPDQQGFMDHPFSWIHDKLTDIRSRRDKNGKPLDETDIIQRIFQFSSRATSARMISDIDANWAVIENEKNRYNRMPGIKTIEGEQDSKDLKKNMSNVTAAWDNFLAVLSKPGVPALIGVLTSLTERLNDFQAGVVAITSVPGLSSLGSVFRGFASALELAVSPVSKIVDALHRLSSLSLPSWVPGFGGKTVDPAPPAEKHSSRMSEPLYVHVANAGDIGRGVTGGLADGMSRPSSGPTFQDYRFDTPTPGFAVG